MHEQQSLTKWIQLICDGDDAAAEKIWEECYPRLVRLARKRLEGVPRKMADEEDVALSALKSFCKAARMGRFPDLKDQSDLWRILISITIRKAIDLRRYESRRPAIGESAFDQADINNAGIQDVPGPPSEQMVAAELAEELEARVSELPEDLQALAIAKLEGCTNPEISKRFDIALRTVERRLTLIRKKWAQGMDTKSD